MCGYTVHKRRRSFPLCFFFNLYLSPSPRFPFDFVVFTHSFVLLHAIKTQVLKILGLIGKKMSAVLFSVWIFFLIEIFLYYVSALRRCLTYYLKKTGSLMGKKFTKWNSQILCHYIVKCWGKITGKNQLLKHELISDALPKTLVVLY